VARKIAMVVEALGAAAVVVFVVLLFTNQPTAPPAAPAAAIEAAAGIDGAAIYKARCASCHGGDGSGGIGPRLAGRMVSAFPEAAEQVSVVADGRRGMPGFESRLSPEEIDAVVEYTRTVLGA
jgi:cytochrome c oxidase subunit II